MAKVTNFIHRVRIRNKKGFEKFYILGYPYKKLHDLCQKTSIQNPIGKTTWLAWHILFSPKTTFFYKVWNRNFFIFWEEKNGFFGGRYTPYDPRYKGMPYANLNGEWSSKAYTM